MNKHVCVHSCVCLFMCIWLPASIYQACHVHNLNMCVHLVRLQECGSIHWCITIYHVDICTLSSLRALPTVWVIMILVSSNIMAEFIGSFQHVIIGD